MILNFIFSHLNVLVLVARLLLVLLIALRYYRPTWLRTISYKQLVLFVAAFSILYGLFVTWGQYHVWAISDITGTYIKMPYFAHYAWTNFWMNIAISFSLSFVLYALFKMWSYYRGGFVEQGTELLLAVMLASSYPGILVLVIVGFAFAVMGSIYAYVRRKPVIQIEPPFIWASFVAILFARVIILLHVL